MIGSTLRSTGPLLAGLCLPALASAQQLVEPAVIPKHLVAVIGLALAMVIVIVAIALYHDRSVRRQRLAAIERLVAAGHTPPSELVTGLPAALPLPEERR